MNQDTSAATYYIFFLKDGRKKDKLYLLLLSLTLNTNAGLYVQHCAPLKECFLTLAEAAEQSTS